MSDTLRPTNLIAQMPKAIQPFSPAFRGIWERVWVLRRTLDCKKGFPKESFGAHPHPLAFPEHPVVRLHPLRRPFNNARSPLL